MTPILQKADVSDKELIKSLLKSYFDELGNPHEYKYLDNYWVNENRHPFLIKSDGKVAGFVFVNEKDPQSYPDFPLGIAEFYVKKEFRHKGIGEDVATQIFDMFPGKWTIRELDNNQIGQTFWRKVIGKYTKGNFKELYVDNKIWKGPIQIFDSSR